MYSHHQVVFRFEFLVRFAFHFYHFVCILLLHAFCILKLTLTKSYASKHINHRDWDVLLRKAFNILSIAMAQVEKENTHTHTERTRTKSEAMRIFCIFIALCIPLKKKPVNFLRYYCRVELKIRFVKVAKSHESVWKSRKTVWNKPAAYLSICIHIASLTVKMQDILLWRQSNKHKCV